MPAPRSARMRVEWGGMEASLVAATWGLVVVTALLVIATLVPQVIAQRATTKQLAAQIVPDMHILNSNLRAMSNKLLDADDWLKDDTEVEIEEAGQFLRMLGPITQVRSAGLEFASEMFICRHLMTQARLLLGERTYCMTRKVNRLYGKEMRTSSGPVACIRQPV
jgi:hypothetical protein